MVYEPCKRRGTFSPQPAQPWSVNLNFDRPNMKVDGESSLGDWYGRTRSGLSSWRGDHRVCDCPNTQEAVEAFSKQGNVTLGANLSAAAGPVGRTAEANVALQAATYTYSISQGLFAGVFFEGTVIATRDEANAEYYGKSVAARDILAGKVKPPAGERKLLQVLSKYSA
jgi:hypothetical protein